MEIKNSKDEPVYANVLLVDDIRENIYSLESLLTQDDVPVQFLHATSGNEALKLAYKGDIALILLDVQMPDMDGYEVASVLKQNKATQHIPIIFVTALSHDSVYITEAYSKGAIDYLFKPLDPFITRSKVNSFINIYLEQKKLERAYRNLELLVQERTVELNKKNAELSQEVNRRTNIEAELNIQIKRLLQLNKDLDLFVYNASHDLKLPVANLQALVTALKEELPVIQDEVGDIMGMMDQSVCQLKHTLHDLLDIIKKEQNGYELEYFDCDQVLEEIKISIGDMIKKSNVTIVSDFSGCDTFKFNRVAFKSILYNLITNSVKYAHPERPAHIDIRFVNEKDEFVLYIKDNGSGLSEEQQNKLFQLFERMKHHESEGSGMGLYIVKNLVDKYGGSIKVSSKKDEGTEFVFVFPKHLPNKE